MGLEKRSVAGAAFAATSLLVTACAVFLAPATALAADMARVPAPTQFVAFCDRYPTECDADAVRPVASAAPATVFAPAAGRARSAAPAYDWANAFAASAAPAKARSASQPLILAGDHVLGRLSALNTEVNRTVRFRSDEALFGKDDYWSLPVLGRGGFVYGDCEDIALQKRSQLLAEGFDGNALSLAVVRTPKGEVHAILLVATDKGEMVLDNLAMSVTPWTKSRYQLIARQVAGDTASWIQPS